MKIKGMIGAVILVLMLQIAVFAHWSDPYCETLYEKGILYGDEQGFRGEDPLLRCEFVAMLNRAFSFSYPQTEPILNDVSSSAWYYEDFVRLYHAGVVTGDENGRFLPEEPINRAEMAVMLARAMHLNVSNIKSPDVTDVPHYAYGAVSALREASILSGYPDGTFRGGEVLKRGEAAAALVRALEVSGFSGGNGSLAHPYLITRPEQFSLISQNVNANYKLVNDITFDQIPMPVIGSEKEPFTGSFDGGMYRIVATNSKEDENVLFYKVGETGLVTKVRLVCPQVRMSVCRINAGKISYCANTSFAGTNGDYIKNFGGIAHENTGKIIKCYNSSAVCAQGSAYGAGGIAGVNKGTIEACFNLGKTQTHAGGIAYTNSGTITDCYTQEGKLYHNGKGKVQNVYAGKNAAQKFAADGFTVHGDRLVIEDFPYYANENFTLYNGGDGSLDNPYRVQTAAQFLNISQNPYAHYVQSGDIEGLTQGLPVFYGSYNGNGFSFRSMRLQAKQPNNALILENYGALNYILATDSFVNAEQNAAGLVYENYGSVEKSAYYGLVSGNRAAGLVFHNQSGATIGECYVQGNVEADREAAGITLYNNGALENCYGLPTVLGNTAAGIAYYNYGQISAVFFAGQPQNDIGGVVYQNNGNVVYGFSTTDSTVLVNNGNVQQTATRTFTQIQDAITFVGFDFLHTWTMAEEQAHPVLRANRPSLSQQPENYIEFAGGDGSINNPYRIVTPMHLKNVGRYADADFILMNDLMLHDFSAYPIAQQFTGTFFGNGKTLYGVQGENPLFAENKGVIRGLYIQNAVMQGEQVCPVVTHNAGTLEHIVFTGSIDAAQGAGIALFNSGHIEKCATEGQFSGQAAGIVLQNSGKITDCYSTAQITGEAAYGIANNMGGSVENSWFGGYIVSANNCPLPENNVKNSFYLNYYGHKNQNAKTIAELQQKPQLLSTSFVLRDNFPVLSNMPVLTLPLFDLEGTGSAADPYQIRRSGQLKYLGMYTDKAFSIVHNIWFDGELFAPVLQFSGTLNGNHHSVHGLTVRGNQAGLVAELFGKIQNVYLTDALIEGTQETGALAAINHGTIENCKVENSRVGTSGIAAGGLCGRNAGNGVVYGGSVKADVFSAMYTGGVCGINDGTVTLSRSLGGAVSAAQADVGASGGIAGRNNGVVDRSYNNGKAFSYSESSVSYAGGIAGQNAGSIRNSYNVGEPHAKANRIAYAGGITGSLENKGTVSNCYNLGFINATADQAFTGSAIGLAKGGTLNGFVFESTLAQPVGSGEVQTNAIYDRGIDVMYRKEGYPGFDFNTVWQFDYDNGFYTAQLADNTQTIYIPQENLTDFAGGDGSLDNPYRILTPAQLSNVRKYLGSAFLLMGDLDMSGFCAEQEFYPIGDTVFSFYGMFIGNNYTVSGLRIAGEEFGLFRENHGEIYNCFFDDVHGEGSGGTVAAYNTGLIYNCMQAGQQTVLGNTQNTNRGGLVGINKSTGMIISSYNAGDLTVNGENVQTGGIAYGNHGVISGCFNSGIVQSEGQDLSVSGGIAAHNFGIISDCYTANDILATAKSQTASFAGGIVGNNGGNVVNCYLNANMVQGGMSGGLAATNNGQIVNGYSSVSRTIGTNSGKTTNVRALTRQQLLSQESFNGFDFENMWIMDAAFRYPYPQLLEIAHR